MHLQFSHTSLQYPNSSEIYRKVACKLQNDFWYKIAPAEKTEPLISQCFRFFRRRSIQRFLVIRPQKCAQFTFVNQP